MNSSNKNSSSDETEDMPEIDPATCKIIRRGPVLGEQRRLNVTVVTAPRLSSSEQEDYDRICERLKLAEASVRRFKRARDQRQLAIAEARLALAKEARAQFVGPRVCHLHAPMRILVKFETQLKGGTRVGRHECEMVLEYVDLPGPTYRIDRSVNEDGMLVLDKLNLKWSAIDPMIATGKIVVLP